LLIPIETDVLLLQTVLDDAIWTLHSPSKEAAAAGVAVAIPANSRARMASADLRK
jgi:hypothetical protein